MEEKKEIKEKAKSGSASVDKFSGYIAAFLAGALIAGGLCWYTMDYSKRDVRSVGEDFVVTKECREILEKNAGISDDNNAVNSALEAYVSSIAVDRYTAYLPEDALGDTIKYVNGSGTAKCSGFQVGVSDDGNILLTEVTEGMPAYTQGLRAGDEITAIDGNSVSEAGVENIANKMLGKDETRVTFTVLRGGETFDISFIRASEMTSSVKYTEMGDVAYIRISGFDQIAKGQLNQVLENAKGKKKYIFDVRGNGGGETEAGIYMAAEFCGHAKCVLNDFNEEEEVVEQDFELEASERKAVVLINEMTASAAEIFTAVLKSNADAKLVGVNTYGKGIYQREAVLSNGGRLHYTAGSFTVEGWDNWDGTGIAPDVEVPMDSSLAGSDNDVQLKKAIALLD